MQYPASYLLHKKYALIEFILFKVSTSLRKHLLHHSVVSTTGNVYYADFLKAIDDCCDFLKIDLATFTQYFLDHPKWAQEVWEKSNGNPDVFNNTIAEQYADKNLAANCIYSFSLKYSYDTLYYYLHKLASTQKEVVVCDYGCANANISFAMAQRKLITNLQCTDLPNMSADFIAYRAKKHNLKFIEWHDVRDFAWSHNQFDAVICFDVLEHLPHPSSLVNEVLYPMLKQGGILLLQAPWGGGVPSHLDEAIIDFYQNGGKSFISKRFKKIYSMAAMDISGVWQKK
jgi:2-polyprenyl-3-methyl-5-hydroxy-6-metoxy-1,4-benzoquinol methylase